MKIVVKALLALFILLGGFFLLINFKFNSLAKQKYSGFYKFEIKEDVARADIKLGERIYHVRNGCVDCHGEDLAGRSIIDDPAMGTIKGANITPFNLGTWSDEEIVRAIRYGVHKTGRSLMFMPSFEFEHLSKEDLSSLVAYIRSVPSVNRSSHKNYFGPMAKILAVFGKIPIMFPAKYIDLDAGFGKKPTEAPSYEFGRYLAASCTGCHGKDLKGGPIPGGDPSWPQASNIRMGSDGKWSFESYMKFMENGISPVTGKAPQLPMPMELLKQFNETEKRALWSYLSELE